MKRLTGTVTLKLTDTATGDVETVQEMVNMIAIQRNYEANQKVITTYDKSMDITVNQIGKV